VSTFEKANHHFFASYQRSEATALFLLNYWEKGKFFQELTERKTLASPHL
jgi:hypothetical protein